MSTYVYLKCLSHDPPLVNDAESGQHLYDLPRIRAEIKERDALVRNWNMVLNQEGSAPVDFYGYFPSHSIRFLAEHPACQLGIVDEYGREHATEDDS